MKLKLTRRQFSLLAVLATAATTTRLFTNKILAQESSTVILGVRPGDISDTNTSTDPNSDTTDLTDGKATADIVSSSLQTIVVESFDVGSLEIKTVLTTPPILETGEQLSGFASLKDGRLVVAATNINTDNKKRQSVRLIFLSDSKSVPISGLKNQEALRSLLRLKDGTLVGLVNKINGTPPSRIVRINPNTGQITNKSKIPDQKRVTTIAQCPDENFYRIATKKTGDTYLFQFGQEKSIKLSFDGQPWNSGFIGLVCAGSNQLYALGALRHQEYPFYLHIINGKTGKIKRIQKEFNVSAITIR